MKSLAIDYGKKRLGFAVGYRQIGLVTPLFTMKRTSPQADLTAILKMIEQYDVYELVIGRPSNMDGTKAPIALDVEQFAAFLKKRLTLPIHWVDERLSSVEAENRLHDIPASIHKKKSVLDAMSAVIILERYFASGDLL